MNKHLLGFVILSLFSTATLAASVPNTFTAGTAASAAEVNANFRSLVTAVTTLETKVAALEAMNTPLTAADVAGTYQILSIASTTGSLLATKKFTSGTDAIRGTVIFNANGTFVGTVDNSMNQFSGKAQDCRGSAGATDIAFPGQITQHAHGYAASICDQNAAVFTSIAQDNLGRAVSGTWALNPGTSSITVTPPFGTGFVTLPLTVYFSKPGRVGFSVEINNYNNPDTPGRVFGLSVFVKQ